MVIMLAFYLLTRHCDMFLRQVICRSLGYEGGWSLAFSRAYLGIGSEDNKVLVDSPGCQGDEEWIEQCPLVTFGNSNCSHIEDSSVFCYDGVSDLQFQLRSRLFIFFACLACFVWCII